MAERTLVDTSERSPSYLWLGANGSYLKVSPSAYYLLKSVEEGASFEAIAVALSRRYGRGVPAAEVEAAYRRVTERVAELGGRAEQAPSGFLLRLPFVPERAVIPLARSLAPAYRPTVAAGVLAGAAASLGLALRDGLTLAFSPTDYWIGYGLFVISLLFHELGHAGACARYGARPGDIGFGLYWIFPVFYSDVSAAWRLKRWQRVVVDLGGVYLQGVVAAGYAAAYLLWGWAPLKVAVVMIAFSSLFILNPFLKFDGYWVVADALGVTNLGAQRRRIRRRVWAALRGWTVDPLPWPPAISAILAVYAALTLGFWGYFAWRLVPFLAAQVVGYPTLLATTLTELLSPPHLPSPRRLSALLTSTYFVVLNWFLLRRVAEPLLRRIRSRPRRSARKARTIPSATDAPAA